MFGRHALQPYKPQPMSLIPLQELVVTIERSRLSIPALGLRVVTVRMTASINGRVVLVHGFIERVTPHVVQIIEYTAQAA